MEIFFNIACGVFFVFVFERELVQNIDLILSLRYFALINDI